MNDERIYIVTSEDLTSPLRPVHFVEAERSGSVPFSGS